MENGTLKPIEMVCGADILETKYFTSVGVLEAKKLDWEEDAVTKKIVKRFCGAIEMLVRMALEDTPTLPGTRVFRILRFGEPDLVTGITANSLLQREATRIIANPSDLALARLCDFVLLALLNMTETVEETCGFVFQLLRYIDRLVVADMFETILGDDAYMKAQRWLVSRNFGAIIVQEIKTMTDPTSECMRSFLRILKKSASCDGMGGHFATMPVISVLSGSWLTGGVWEDERWEAIASLYSSATRDPFRAQLMASVEVLKTGKTRAQRCMVAAVDFLCSILTLDTDMHPFLVMCRLGHVVVDLMDRFPGCSILLVSLIALARYVSREPCLAAEFVPTVVTFALKEISASRTTTLRAACYTILLDVSSILELAQVLSSIEGYTAFVGNQLREFITVTSQSYGQAPSGRSPMKRSNTTL